MKVSVGFMLTLAVMVLGVLGAGSVMIADVNALGRPRIELMSSSVKVTHDLEYGLVGSTALRLDVYEPRTWSLSVAPRPAILMIHGGGWIEGDKESERDLAALLVPKGYVAFAINYRLAFPNKVSYPAPVLDVRRAVRWVRAHAQEYGIDPDRVGAVGWSAGGHLSALLGTTDLTDPTDANSLEMSSRVACVVDTAGPTDFTDEASPAIDPRSGHLVPLLFGSKSRSEIPDSYRDASPVAHVDAHSAPTLILHGTDDPVVPVDQSRRFERALKASGVEVNLVEFTGYGHGFITPDAHDRWLGEIDRFLAAHLNP